MSKNAQKPHYVIGIDIGGTGIKGGIVNLKKGELVGDRFRIDTPQPSTPQAVAKVVKQIVDELMSRDEAPSAENPVGVDFPAIIAHGVARSAANVDKSWIGTDVDALLTGELDRPVHVMNDADAAGIAEDSFGAGKDTSGVVILLTFGTGIGSAVLHNGVLLPNTEFGHLEVDGKEAEHRAASSVKEKKDWSYKEWAVEVSRVLTTFENLLWPDLFIAGGGISRKHEKWIPHLTNRTKVVPATLLNTAGIAGAALASVGLTRPASVAG